MAGNDLPREVTRLIASVVASMDHIEVLRRLHARIGQPISMDSLVADVQIDRASLQRIMHELEGAGLLRHSEDGVTFSPSPADLAAVESLIHMYNTRPVTLVRAVYARPSPVRAFADAFRIRRDE